MESNMNPIDRFNKEKITEMHTLLQKQDRTVKETEPGKWSYKLNTKDEPKLIYEVHEHGFIFHDQVESLQFDPGLVSAFEILVRFEFKGKYSHAFYQVMSMYKKEIPFIRVSDTYFRLANDGNLVKRLKHNKAEVKEDVGNNLSILQKYYGFKMEPDNINWKRNIKGWYNTYHEIPIVPKKFNVDVKDYDNNSKQLLWSLAVLHHIFGDQFELGLQYMQCLYLYPKQILPILALVSGENETGKSTFGEWLVELFGENATVLNAKNFGKDFNSEYAERTFIIIEEMQYCPKEISSLIKSLATQKSISVNKKNQQEFTQDFYGKFIMTSNKEVSFIDIEEEDLRYWVRKIPPLTKGLENHSIMKDLTNEAPHFLYFLSQLPPLDFSRSRQMFTKHEIWTLEKDLLQDNSHDAVYVELKDFFYNWFNDHDSEELKFVLGDLFYALGSVNQGGHEKFRFSKKEVKGCLQGDFKLRLIPGSSYPKMLGRNVDIGPNATYMDSNDRYIVEASTQITPSKRNASNGLADKVPF